jgi:predicted TIM-barrel fold metal-dependent hydrolase
MMIDAHTHITGEPDYLKRLVDAELAIGMDRFVTFGAGPAGRWATNDEVLAAAEKYPDMIIPFAYVTLGQVTPREVELYARRGFKGFKCINPTLPYNDGFFMPIYAKMAELALPVYFHTGIVSALGDERGFNIDTERHKIIHLDRILRKFPELVVLAAHLGNPDYGEGGMLLRWWPNLYSDLSGSTLKKKTPAFLKEILWWDEAPGRSGRSKEISLGTYNNDPYGRGPWEKIVFGTDVSPDKVTEVKADYDRLMDALELPQRLRDAVFGGNAAKALGFEKL